MGKRALSWITPAVVAGVIVLAGCGGGGFKVTGTQLEQKLANDQMLQGRNISVESITCAATGKLTGTCKADLYTFNSTPHRIFNVTFNVICDENGACRWEAPQLPATWGLR